MGTSTFDIYLINGNITVFCGAHAEAFKHDILISSLLGDLVSISKHSNSREQLWSDYIDTVGKIGWTTNSRTVNRYRFSNKSLLHLVKLGAENALTKEEKQSLVDAFMHLKKPPSQSLVISTLVDRINANTFVADDESHTLASSKTPITTSTRLTIVRNDASFITLQVAFKTTDGVSIDLLDQPVLSHIEDGKSNIWLLSSALDARQYTNVREAVIKKIGNHINTDLLHVPTPNRMG